MAYLGNSPTSSDYQRNTYIGATGITSFGPMSVAPATETSIIVIVGGVIQDVSAYNINGFMLDFTEAPANGTPIQVIHLGVRRDLTAIPDSSVVRNMINVQGVIESGYSKQVPTTEFSITIPDNVSRLILDPASTLATGTITMPANPKDGSIVGFSTTQEITALTVSPNAGQTAVKNAPTKILAGGDMKWIYVLANTTWYIT